VGNFGTAVWSGNLSTWNTGSGLPVTFGFNAVAYGNLNNTPTFVTVGQGNSPTYTGPNTYYSINGGNTWTAATTGPPSKYHAYNGVAYGNGIFVAVGVTNGGYPAVGVIYDSFDGGKNWTQIPPALFTAPPAPFSSVTFANGFFVATTSGGNIWVSPDGANWTQTSIVASGSLRAVASGDYQYIAVGDGGAILGSVLFIIPPGSFSPPSPSNPCASFEVMGPPGPVNYSVYVSSDLISWAPLPGPPINFSHSSIVQVQDCSGLPAAYYYLGPAP
jgi:hypothetical protein